MGKTGRRDLLVKVGRVCLINNGEDNGKLCTILDIIDQNRALVDGPVEMTGVHRQQLNFKSLSLTPQTIIIGRNPRPSTLATALMKAKVLENFAKSNWAKKNVKAQFTKSLTDFDRFRHMILHKKRQDLIKREMARLRKAGQMPTLKQRPPTKKIIIKKKQPKIKRALPKAIVDDEKTKKEDGKDGKDGKEGGKTAEAPAADEGAKKKKKT